MSIKALHWAWHVDDLDMGPAFLLAKLGDMCDQDHSCYPDHKYLMKMIRVKSRNTLRKHMDVLYERDLVRLQIQHSSKGLRINNRYYLAVDGKFSPNAPSRTQHEQNRNTERNRGSKNDPPKSYPQGVKGLTGEGQLIDPSTNPTINSNPIVPADENSETMENDHKEPHNVHKEPQAPVYDERLPVSEILLGLNCARGHNLIYSDIKSRFCEAGFEIVDGNNPIRFKHVDGTIVCLQIGRTLDSKASRILRNQQADEYHFVYNYDRKSKPDSFSRIKAHTQSTLSVWNQPAEKWDWDMWAKCVGFDRDLNVVGKFSHQHAKNSWNHHVGPRPGNEHCLMPKKMQYALLMSWGCAIPAWLKLATGNVHE